MNERERRGGERLRIIYPGPYLHKYFASELSPAYTLTTQFSVLHHFGVILIFFLIKSYCFIVLLKSKGLYQSLILKAYQLIFMVNFSGRYWLNMSHKFFSFFLYSPLSVSHFNNVVQADLELTV